MTKSKSKLRFNITAPLILLGITLIGVSLIFMSLSRANHAIGSLSTSHIIVKCGLKEGEESMLGLPAIKPRSNCIPAFTEADVRAFLSTNYNIGKITFTSIPQVDSVVFEDGSLFEKDYEIQLGLPPNSLICVARLSGSLLPPNVSSNPSTPKTATEFVVFDAQTGNIIVNGITTK